MSNTAAPHDDPLPDDEIMYHLVGVTTADLDPDHPADLMLQAVTKRYVRARDDVTHYAMRIANEMRRVGEQHPNYRTHSMLADSSDSRRYDEAIATVRVLNDLLGVAAHAYQLAHPTPSPRPERSS